MIQARPTAMNCSPGRGPADPDERECGRNRDHAPEVPGHQDDSRRDDVGEEVAEDDPCLAGAQRPGGLDVIRLSKRRVEALMILRVGHPGEEDQGEHEQFRPEHLDQLLDGGL